MSNSQQTRLHRRLDVRIAPAWQATHRPDSALATRRSTASASSSKPVIAITFHKENKQRKGEKKAAQ
jgi:hypothetical protein